MKGLNRLRPRDRWVFLTFAALLLWAGEAGAADLVINLVGDIGHPDELGGWRVDHQGKGVFAQVQRLLDDGDLNFGNLESPLTLRTPRAKVREPLHCPPKRLSYVVDSRFNLLSIANNHTLDASGPGVVDTLETLELAAKSHTLWWSGANLTPAEALEPTIVKLEGQRIAFFAVTAAHPRGGVASIHSPSLLGRITKAAKLNDGVIVSVHFGIEYVHVPGLAVQKRYRGYVDAGASLVVGHHPHVIQGVERYKGGLIFYSLGNFSFGATSKQYFKQGARMFSLMARVVLSGGVVTQAELVPLYVNNTEPWVLGQQTLPARYAVPQLVWDDFAQWVLDEMDRFTGAIGGQATVLHRVGDRAFVDVAGPPSAAARKDSRARQAGDKAAAIAVGGGPRAATAAELAMKPRPRASLRTQQLE